MAVKQNASDQEVAGGGIKLYTGITPMSVLAVNPTLTELHAMDLQFQKEPKYAVDFGKGPVQKAVIWLGNEETKVPLEILITAGPWKSGKNDKYKWYNISGQDVWTEVQADGTPNPANFRDWHQDTDTFYQIPRGIDTLTDFVKAWANVASGDECKLDTIDAICQGDMSEIREMIKAFAANQVRVLVYVRDGKYQGIYSEHFGRLRPERNDLFTKAMGANLPYSQVPGEFSLPWQTYTPGVATPDAPAAGAGEEIPTDEDWLKDGDPLDATAETGF